jgi:cytochrome c5
VTVAHDKKFFNTFMVVLGILVGIAIILYILARVVASDTQVAEVQASDEMRRAISDRIKPIAKVAVSGQDNSALEPPKPAAAATADLGGEEVFKQTCTACHGTGVAGAPKVGDAAAWGPRIAKGADTLHKHAIEGFQGSAGFMPPKGGATSLSDKSIMNAVDYMVSQVKK